MPLLKKIAGFFTYYAFLYKSVNRFLMLLVIIILALFTQRYNIFAQVGELYSQENDEIAGITPLMNAVTNNDVDGVRFFSKGGVAVINQQNFGGATALHLACRQGNVEMVKILLENGAEVNMMDFEGWSPLMRAAFANNFEIIELLLAKGAAAQLVNSGGESAIIHATLSNCDNCLNLLFSRFNFIKYMDIHSLKEQLGEAFIIARNHESKISQNLIETYLNQVVKLSPLMAKKNNPTKTKRYFYPSINNENNLALNKAVNYPNPNYYFPPSTQNIAANDNLTPNPAYQSPNLNSQPSSPTINDYNIVPTNNSAAIIIAKQKQIINNQPPIAILDNNIKIKRFKFISPNKGVAIYQTTLITKAAPTNYTALLNNIENKKFTFEPKNIASNNILTNNSNNPQIAKSSLSGKVKFKFKAGPASKTIIATKPLTKNYVVKIGKKSIIATNKNSSFLSNKATDHNLSGKFVDDIQNNHNQLRKHYNHNNYDDTIVIDLKKKV
jgi:ankyrin repeat protein